MLILTENFNDYAFLVFVMLTHEEERCLSQWGGHESAVSFSDKENFVQHFEDLFNKPLDDWVKDSMFDNNPLVGTIHLENWYDGFRLVLRFKTNILEEEMVA